MFQIVSMWNLSNPEVEMAENIGKVEKRGYNPATYLASQYANKITSKEIKPLAVSNIADKYCPVRRDLYYAKGKNEANILYSAL